MSRKSPTEHAADYKLGTRKKGNDGNTWIIIKTKSGTKRWKKEKKEKKEIGEIKNVEDKISWNISKPLNTMGIFVENERIKVPKSYLEKKINIKKGDRIVLLYHDGEPIITEPVVGSTLLSVFKAIERGVNRKINPNVDFEQKEKIYQRISGFTKSQMRLELTRKYEAGTLKIKELLGDHVWYEGGLRRKNGIWRYGLGS